MSSEVAIDCAGYSHVGVERHKNEDHFLVADLARSILIQETTLSVDQETIMLGGSEGKLLIVADGAGGHSSGERASELAVHTITHFALNVMPWFFRIEERHENALVGELQSGLERCHEILTRDAQTHPEHRSMATTLTMAYVLFPRVYILHAGDSRSYLMRNSKLVQITNDHTYADNLANSAFAGVLWNAVVADSKHAVKPEVHKLEVRGDDILLLCTDGLNKHVGDGDILKIVESGSDAHAIARALVESANAGGGSDNTTVIVARFLEP